MITIDKLKYFQNSFFLKKKKKERGKERLISFPFFENLQGLYVGFIGL